MARGWHYIKLSLSSALLLSFSGMCILFLFLSFCRFFLFRCVFFCSRWSFVDVPLIFFCTADHVTDWQPRILLGIVEARTVDVKKTTTTNNSHSCSRRPAVNVVLERRGFLFAATQPIHTVSALYWRRTDSIINPGNVLMGCALASDLAPEAATVSPLITGDRPSL